MNAQQANRAKAEKLEALTRLGVARRERLDKADFDVYLTELEGIPAMFVIEACRRLSREQPGEYEPRFPSLATLISYCSAVIEEKRRRDTLKLPPRQEERASPERIGQLIADIKAALSRHDMNKPKGKQGAA